LLSELALAVASSVSPSSTRTADRPTMQAATVGVAFGQNSDITAEAADAVCSRAFPDQGR
jgi:hypothetical protein